MALTRANTFAALARSMGPATDVREAFLVHSRIDVRDSGRVLGHYDEIYLRVRCSPLWHQLLDVPVEKRLTRLQLLCGANEEHCDESQLGWIHRKTHLTHQQQAILFIDDLV